MVVSLHLSKLLILARPCLAALLSQSLSVSEQPRSTIHGAPPLHCRIHLILSTSTFCGVSQDTVTFSFFRDGVRGQTEGKQGLLG